MEGLLKEIAELAKRNELLQKQVSEKTSGRRASPGIVFPNEIVRVSYSKDRKVSAVVRVKTSPNHYPSPLILAPSSPRASSRESETSRLVTPVYLS